MTFKYNIYIVIFFSVLLLVCLYFLHFLILEKLRNGKNKDKKNETIISNIAEPYFIEERISPLTVSLTPDNIGENGGLAYLNDNTDELNNKMVHEYFQIEHEIVLPKDTQIIFGSGTSMMVIALYYALQKKLDKSISITTNTRVFYILHKKLSKLLKNIDWSHEYNNSYADLAVVVSPSNPLGIITEPKQISQPYMLYDVVYDKITFTGENKTVNPELYKEFERNKNIFITTSFSKLGIPGVRCGFLITRDPEIAEYCKEYINITLVRYSSAAMTIGRIAFYKYYNNVNWHLTNFHILKKRCNEFIKASKKHNIQILNKTFLVPFIYTDKSVDWWMTNFNVETRKGSDFNDTDECSRFNLMITDEWWDEFMRRFQM
jgi:aspartate/methionine/tyrosine aminotransferase